MGGDNGWQAAYSDPVRWRFLNDSREFSAGAAPQPESFENELCSVQMLAMHKPTHEPKREQSGEYPFSHLLNGHRRLWEIRFQVRFKKLPQKQLYVGIELGTYVPLSTMSRQAQKALVGACRSIVGDCYHSPGDDPAITKGEVERPAFVMPLWAFDQFIVSEPGAEPDLRGNLEGAGLRRSDGVRNYIRSMTSTLESLSTDKVYTFCFWGVSQFLDIYRWEVVGGLLPGVKMDFNKLCGGQPVSISIYELNGETQQGADERHLQSRKQYYFSVSMYSMLKPPAAAPAAPSPAASEPEEELVDAWGYPIGFGAVQDVAPAPKAPDLGFDDLLGLEVSPAASAPAAAAPEKPLAQSFDLLDLGN